MICLRMWKNNHLFFHKPYSVHNMCTSCAYSGITIYNETKSLARKPLFHLNSIYLHTRLTFHKYLFEKPFSTSYSIFPYYTIYPP